jgi:hypothetical protein
MKIDILVEEPSMKGFLEPVLPKIISPPDTWSVHVLSCFKTKLEKRLCGFLIWTQGNTEYHHK